MAVATAKRRRVSVVQEAMETNVASTIDNMLLYLNASDITDCSGDAMPFIRHVGMNALDLIDVGQAAFKRQIASVVPGKWRDSAIFSGLRSGSLEVATVESLSSETVRRMTALGAFGRFEGSHVSGVLSATLTRISRSGAATKLDDDKWVIRDGELWPAFDVGTRLVTQFGQGGRDSSRFTEFDEQRLSAERLCIPGSVVWVQNVRRSSWVATFRTNADRSVSVPTDPTGIKGMFQMRELPEGRDRRAALLHWVSAHMRRNRKDPETEHAVRQYLRGSREFEWFGMSCKITPTEF